ncbi:type II toxin-antitoxin system death-on-curing family toxin [Listeria booriae]|uniref:type II toxin-antitoxin system death-on-curing family toxin n=2 Tax=Listeria booriae TaxID=1552123 RepID=UPI001625103C|nr:type II toxin-antitoxin system death-on-curing family toxin [Listeria booriae]MBC1559086.1 type II toxin-antitoxin system death-on-curing family toxin [Listeria booriae]MBC2194150.1 type II toxin-antitoxin system death-on-curing family toxin [Listeria booriae]
MTIRYLTEPEIIMLNGLLIKKYSPMEPIGVVEPNSLNMSVELPKQIVFNQELYPSIPEKAGILYKNLVIKHCFANANKRTALASLGLFLKYNGWQLLAGNQDAEDFTVAIALDSNMALTTISNWIEKNSAMPKIR